MILCRGPSRLIEGGTMKRLMPLLLALSCGCSQDRVERREKLGKCLVLSAVLGAKIFADAYTDDAEPLDYEQAVESQNHIHPGGRLDPP